MNRKNCVVTLFFVSLQPQFMAPLSHTEMGRVLGQPRKKQEYETTGIRAFHAVGHFI